MTTSVNLFTGFPLQLQTLQELFASWSKETHKYEKMYFGVRPQISGISATIYHNEYCILSMKLDESAEVTDEIQADIDAFLELNSNFFMEIFNELPANAVFYGRFVPSGVDEASPFAVGKVSNAIFYIEGCYYPDQTDTSNPLPEKLFAQYSDITYILGLPSAGKDISNGKIVYERRIAPVASFSEILTVDFTEQDALSKFEAQLAKNDSDVDPYIWNLFRVKGKGAGYVVYPMFSSAPTLDVMALWTARSQ